MTGIGERTSDSTAAVLASLAMPGVRRIGAPPQATGRRVAIVGLGMMGARHITAALQHGHRVTGLVDPSAEPFALREHPSLAAVKVSALAELNPANVDVLVIATTAQFHYSIACEAIAAGFKRIVLEKPATQSVDQAIDIAHRAAAAKVRVSVNHGRRYCDAYIRVRGLKQEMGDIRSVTMRSGGGALGCVGTHWIDLVTTLIDAAPVSVFATGTAATSNPRGAQFVDPGASVMISYATGAVAFIDSRDDVGFIGGLSISFSQGDLAFANEFAPWMLRRRGAAHWDKPLSQYGLPLETSAFAPSALAASLDAQGVTVFSGRDAILAYAAAAMADALGDGEVISGLDAAIQTMAVYAAARSSMLSGRSVSLATLSHSDCATVYPIP